MIRNIDETEFLSFLHQEKAGTIRLIEYQEAVCKRIAKWDNKVYNKRFCDDLQQIQGVYVFRRDNTLSIDIKANNPRNGSWDNVLWIYSISDCLKGEKLNRIDYQKFRAAIRKQIMQNHRALAGIEKDLLDGVERLRTLKRIEEYYTEIIKEFSSEVGSQYSKQLTIEPRFYAYK